MSEFLSRCIYEDIDGENYVMYVPLIYQSNLLSGKIITVPTGFVTDLASIPKLVQPIIPKSGLWNWPAIIHDYLYSIQIFERVICDSILLEAMRVRKTPEKIAFEIYEAVKLFGANSWNEDYIKYGLNKVYVEQQRIKNPVLA